MGDPVIPSATYESETYTIARTVVQATVDDARMPLPPDVHHIRGQLNGHHDVENLEAFVFRLCHQIDRMRPVVEAVRRIESTIEGVGCPGADSHIDAALFAAVAALRAMRGDS